jgi:ACS family glucarate transporter-like MFS transporter
MLIPGGRRLRVRYFLAFWLFVLSSVAFLDRTNISVAGGQISREFGLGNQHLGWILSAFLIGYALFQLPAGALAVRFGPRRILAFGVLCQATATALTAFLPSGIPGALAMLFAIRCILGVDYYFAWLAFGVLVQCGGGPRRRFGVVVLCTGHA